MPDKNEKDIKHLNVALPSKLVDRVKAEAEVNDFQTTTAFIKEIFEKALYRDSTLDLRSEPAGVRKEYFKIDMPIICNKEGYIISKAADNRKIELIIIEENGNHFFEIVELLKFSDFKKENVNPQEIETRFGVKLDFGRIVKNPNIRIQRGYYSVEGKKVIPGWEQRKYFSNRGYDYYLDQIGLVDDYDSFKGLMKLIELPEPKTLPLSGAVFGYPKPWNIHLEDVFIRDYGNFKNDEKHYLRWEWFKQQSKRLESGINKEEWEQAIKGNVEPLLIKLTSERKNYLEKSKKFHEKFKKEEQAKKQVEKARQKFHRKLNNGEKISDEEIEKLKQLEEEYSTLRMESFEEAKRSGFIGVNK